MTEKSIYFEGEATGYYLDCPFTLVGKVVCA